MIGYMKQNRVDKFKEVLRMIQEISNKNRQTPTNAEEQNMNLTNCLKEIVKGEPELEEFTHKALMSGEAQIQAMDMSHLKVNRGEGNHKMEIEN